MNTKIIEMRGISRTQKIAKRFFRESEIFGARKSEDFLGIKIAPSILSADFGKLNEDIKTIEPFADMLHIDVMDGHFVDNISIGPVVVEKINTKLPLDIHLMIDNPEKYVEKFAKVNPEIITFHFEAANNPKKIIDLIKKHCKAGISIKPATSLDKIKNFIENVDIVLIMTVNPGFGGQEFISDMIPKIKELRQFIKNNNLDIDIQVDGGINKETAKLALEAGANILVAGSYIFKADNRKEAIESLKG